MPSVFWYFCHDCGYRSQFVAAAEDKPYRCPKCHERHVESIMRRRDGGWMKGPTGTWPPPKDAA